MKTVEIFPPVLGHGFEKLSGAVQGYEPRLFGAYGTEMLAESLRKYVSWVQTLEFDTSDFLEYDLKPVIESIQRLDTWSRATLPCDIDQSTAVIYVRYLRRVFEDLEASLITGELPSFL